MLIPSLTQYCVNPRDARLERDDMIRAAQIGSRQLNEHHKYATSELNVPISIDALTRAFGCAYESLKQSLADGLELPEIRGHHSALPPDIAQQIRKWIEQNAAKSIGPTGRDSREHPADRHKLAATRDWVNSCLRRHAQRLGRVTNARKKCSASKFVVVAFTRQVGASLNTCRTVQLTLSLTSTKSASPNGRTATQRA
jgi:hypothetical protein